MAWKRSTVRTRPGPPNLFKHLGPFSHVPTCHIRATSRILRLDVSSSFVEFYWVFRLRVTTVFVPLRLRGNY